SSSYARASDRLPNSYQSRRSEVSSVAGTTVTKSLASGGISNGSSRQICLPSRCALRVTAFISDSYLNQRAAASKASTHCMVGFWARLINPFLRTQRFSRRAETVMLLATYESKGDQS